jgi:antitoxin (DNA-binding transcriptional repressor) of toxin-antitoxin stability system
MKSAGVRELKAHFSRYLEDVRRGEVVLVTDRGRVVAELRRPQRAVEPHSSSERALVPLVERGEVRLGERSRVRPKPPGATVETSAELIERLVDGLRSEG